MDMEIEAKAQTNKEGFKELFESVKPIIWVIKVIGFESNIKKMSFFTGFAVNKEGYLITCTHNWHSWKPKIFFARRLCQNGGKGDFEMEATLVDLNPSCDLCLLKVSVKLGDTECGKFGSGKLSVGNTVISVGHPHEFVGSGLTGYVAYPSIGPDDDFDYNDKKQCRSSTFTLLAKPPPYRRLGHIFTSGYFKQMKNYCSDFEKHLQANVPILQCAGLVGGEGTSGAPMLNLKGEIVGMFVLQLDGYDIGIHAAAIKKFLDKNSISYNQGPSI